VVTYANRRSASQRPDPEHQRHLAHGFLEVVAARTANGTPYGKGQGDTVWRLVAEKLAVLRDSERNGERLCDATGRDYQSNPPEPDTEGGGS
jgi:hypothetical protein